MAHLTPRYSISGEGHVQVGLDVLRSQPLLAKPWGRCGYVSNQASVDADLVHGVHILDEILGADFTTIFGPQHGFSGTLQDNMIETPHAISPENPRAIFSLYSEIREPTEEMLSQLDTIILDLQIVGCRVYTFKSTMAGCLRSAKRYGKKVVVLDRPNPLGGRYVEGRCVEDGMKSFVGQFSIPMRHGLSAAEAASFFNSHIGADLEIVQMRSWQAHKDWSFTQRPWVLTSPNLPTATSLHGYPGTVAFEGCNVSEGRGTGLPFQFFGAPFCKSSKALIDRVVDHLGGYPSGVYLREAEFEPTSGKWAKITCRGLQVHVLDAEKIASYPLGLALLKAFDDLSEGSFEFTTQAYEYEFDKLPISLILGGEAVPVHFESFEVHDPYWSWGVDKYLKEVEPFLLYKREMMVPAHFTC